MQRSGNRQAISRNLTGIVDIELLHLLGIVSCQDYEDNNGDVRKNVGNHRTLQKDVDQ